MRFSGARSSAMVRSAPGAAAAAAPAVAARITASTVPGAGRRASRPKATADSPSPGDFTAVGARAQSRTEKRGAYGFRDGVRGGHGSAAAVSGVRTAPVEEESERCHRHRQAAGRDDHGPDRDVLGEQAAVRHA